MTSSTLTERMERGSQTHTPSFASINTHTHTQTHIHTQLSQEETPKDSPGEWGQRHTHTHTHTHTVGGSRCLQYQHAESGLKLTSTQVGRSSHAGASSLFVTTQLNFALHGFKFHRGRVKTQDWCRCCLELWHFMRACCPFSEKRKTTTNANANTIDKNAAHDLSKVLK